MTAGFKNLLYPEAAAQKHLVIATTAFRSDTDSAVNCQKMAAVVAEIMQAHPEVELILFGEMILGWYDPPALVKVAETIPGKSSDFLSELAVKYKIYLSFGISEQQNEKRYNTQVLINPQGTIQALHRKWNLKPGEKKAGYQPGAAHITITDIKGIKTGMIICADAADPGTMQALMKARPELILFSLADDQDPKWFVAKANARLYDAWIISANRYGQEKSYWNGHTIISDPLGSLRATLLDQEGYLVHDLKFAHGRSFFRTALRNIWVKIPLLAHVIKNWKIFRSYMN